MEPANKPGFNENFLYAESMQLSGFLTHSLLKTAGLNEFMQRVLPRVGELFGSERLMLIDYKEQTHRFNLLYFEGYPPDSRFSLQRLLSEIDIEQALQQRRPYPLLHGSQHLLCIPFYFRDVLEAALVIELPAPPELSAVLLESAEIVSRVLGLLMSSIRLQVNREHVLEANDLQRARQIQLSFLPSHYPASEHFETYGYNSSSAIVGGDYFDYFQIGDNSIRWVLADACGHGMAAALIMSNFRGLLQREMRNEAGIEQLFDELNELIHFDEEAIQYLTGVFLDLDQTSRRLHYLNAGHYDPAVVSPAGTVRLLPGGGPPLGMFKQSSYVMQQTTLDPGDLVLLFTDGLTEVEDVHGNYWGIEGVLNAVKPRRDQALAEMAQGVLEEARAFRGQSEMDDDLTLVLLRLK